MIPSDHFVRFYNEVFKFLDEKNDIEEYYLHISRHQEFHCLELFKNHGLQGVYDYYLKIRKEENCDLDLDLKEHELAFFMRKCPSLSKALDNDAGACPKYCDHCNGWLAPLLAKAGLYMIYDPMAPDQPKCRIWIFDDRTVAEQKLVSLPPTVKHNF
jgi:hypothetical protein